MLFAYPLDPNPDEADSPVVGWFTDNPEPSSFPPHVHRRAQLMHVTRGVVVLQAEGVSWTVPPHRAAWIPGGIEHSARYPRGVALRSLYIDAAALSLDMPDRCSVLQLDPLGRELIKAVAELPWAAALDGAGARLVGTLFDRLSAAPEQGVSLPLGSDRRLIRVMHALRTDPASQGSIAELAKAAGCSSRTLARLFLEETRMSFGEWRQQLRLQIALERLAAGEPVTRIALDLGYGSPSSFSTMFRRALGTSPARYFEQL